MVEDLLPLLSDTEQSFLHVDCFREHRLSLLLKADFSSEKCVYRILDLTPENRILMLVFCLIEGSESGKKSPWSKFDDFPLDEKRKLYRCGNDYVTLENIPTWSEYLQENSYAIYKRKGTNVSGHTILWRYQSTMNTTLTPFPCDEKETNSKSS